MNIVPETQPARIALMTVVRAELRCVLSTLSLLLRGQIRMPREMVGREIGFADGTRSEIYRETAMREVGTSPRVILAVRFRLRLIGSSRVGHALFRFESLFNTLLFAAHRGFHTKLWLTDRSTNYYRGMMRWRLQVAAQVLTSTSKGVAEVAGEVGYESEPSFNRAFKREFGVPPARFRSRAKRSQVQD